MSIIKFKPLYRDSLIPRRASEGSAGFDLHYHGNEPFMMEIGTRITVGTGIAAAIPEGYVGLIRARSGLATKHGIEVIAGVIDSDYRGEIKVCLINHYEWTPQPFAKSGSAPYQISPGDRIGQLLVLPALLQSEEVNDLDGTERGADGFGSSGR